jgi:flagellar capping protein FliD
MASIQSLGIGSGILTMDLVDDLIAAQREPVDLRLDFQKTGLEAEISAFGSIKSALESMRATTTALSLPSSVQAMTASSSDSTSLTATASSLANAGSYQVTTDYLAQSHTLVTKSYTNMTDVIGTGQLTFNFGTTAFSGPNYDTFTQDTTATSKSLTIDSTNNTLSSLRTAINDADFGVQASVVNDGSGYRLLLASEATGLDNSMEILVSGDAGSGLKELAFNKTYNGTTDIGAITGAGTVDLSTGIDFNATPATFTLTVGATSGIAVTVNLDATTDLDTDTFAGQAGDNIFAIQAAVDTALIAATLSAGDVVVSLDPTTNGVVFTTLATGSSETMEITAGNGELGLNTTAGTQYGSDGSMAQTQAALDASLVVNGLAVTSESNLVTDVISGVTLNLIKADAATTHSLTLSTDSTAIEGKVQDFVDSYNALKQLSNDYTVFDADTNEVGLLLGNSTLRTINSRIRSILTSLVDGISSSSYRSLAEVGITSDQDNDFNLILNTTVLRQAIIDKPDDIVSLFATNSNSTDSQVKVVSAGTNTQPGTYAVKVNQLATQGVYEGITKAGLDGPITIDSANDTFVVTLNGTTSDTVTLTEGIYATGVELATEIQLRINNDDNIVATGDTVAVSYNAGSQLLEFTSSDYGSSSNLTFDVVDTDTQSELGIGVSVGTSTAGLNVKGTINNEAATGSGQTLLASAGDATAQPGYRAGTTLASLGLPLTITAPQVAAGDYRINVTIDAIESGDIDVAAGTYTTGPEMATALQTAINADATLMAASKTVTVDFDATLNNYTIRSGATGTSSTVTVSTLGSSMGTAYGLGTGVGTAGTDGSGEMNAAAGLSVQILDGSLGTRGTVTYIEGITYRLDQLFAEFLDSTGLINNTVGGLNTQVTAIDDERASLDARMEAVEERLIDQFSVADRIIAQLKSSEDFLSQQLSLLNALLDNSN